MVEALDYMRIVEPGEKEEELIWEALQSRVQSEKE